MWRSIRRWLDWLMSNHPWTAARGARPQALHYCWERAGFVVAGQPVPWSAEGLTVEALLRLPRGAGRDRADFTARMGAEAVPADQLRQAEGDAHRAVFRLPAPAATSVVEVCYRGQPIGQMTIPVLSREDYLRQLRLESPTVYARLGGDAVACRTFVAGQCSGLLASAVLSSPAGLVPLLDLEIEVEFRREGARASRPVAVRLAASQLQGKSALLSVASPRAPRQLGEYVVAWRVGGEEVARQAMRAISAEAFQGSLRVVETRFVVQQEGQPVRVVRKPPLAGTASRVGPCFLVASGEPGMAGACVLTTVALVAGAVRPPLLQEQRVLITDGPALVAPGTLDATDLPYASGFELRTPAGVLGLLPLSPAPTAAIDGEGGFRPPPDYAWTPAAEEEMQDRLNRLFGA
jgi:hypothetical protein